MSTVAAKSPKKRKSMSKQENTPSKTPKVEKVQTPKEAKVPKTNITPTNGKQSDNTGKAASIKKSKDSKVKTPVKKENVLNGDKKLEKFKGTKSLSDGKTMTKRQLFVQKLKERSEKEGKEVVVKYLTEKMEAIKSRPVVTKSGNKKYKDYKQLLKYVTGVSISSTQLQAKKESKKPKKAKGADKSNAKAVKIEKEKKVESVSNEDVEDDDDSEAENEEDENIDDEESGDGEESDDGEESVDDEDEEADDETDKKSKKVIKSKAKPEPEAKSSPTKNSRYVLFVGNIAYDTTKEELKDHFKRVGTITDIRIPLEKETNRPRGFAYVELPNEASYQKALDLNGSQLKNRKIHIEYTQGGKKKSEDSKKEIKSKNFKLHAMRKQGQFGKGNKPQFKGKGKPAK